MNKLTADQIQEGDVLLIDEQLVFCVVDHSKDDEPKRLVVVSRSGQPIVELYEFPFCGRGPIGRVKSVQFTAELEATCPNTGKKVPPSFDCTFEPNIEYASYSEKFMWKCTKHGYYMPTAKNGLCPVRCGIAIECDNSVYYKSGTVTDE